MISVTDLYQYPIKSCGGTRVESSELTRFGLKDDRTLMLVDGDGKFITQREQPRLCLVAPGVDDDGSLHVTAPGMSDLQFAPTSVGDTIHSDVWGSAVEATVQQADANDWFSEFLSMPARLSLIHI